MQEKKTSCPYSLFNEHALNLGQCVILGAIFSWKQKRRKRNNETLGVVFRNPEIPSTSLKAYSLLSKVLQENTAKHLSTANPHYFFIRLTNACWAPAVCRCHWTCWDSAADKADRSPHPWWDCVLVAMTHDNEVSPKSLENLRCGECCGETERESRELAGWDGGAIWDGVALGGILQVKSFKGALFLNARLFFLLSSNVDRK